MASGGADGQACDGAPTHRKTASGYFDEFGTKGPYECKRRKVGSDSHAPEEDEPPSAGPSDQRLRDLLNEPGIFGADVERCLYVFFATDSRKGCTDLNLIDNPSGLPFLSDDQVFGLNAGVQSNMPKVWRDSDPFCVVDKIEFDVECQDIPGVKMTNLKFVIEVCVYGADCYVTGDIDGLHFMTMHVDLEEDRYEGFLEAFLLPPRS